MNISFVPFLIAALAVWRFTHLVVHEDGPWHLIARVRGFAGSFLSCFYCFSLWVAVPTAFLLRPALLDFVVLWLALSGAACLLERAVPETVVIEHLPEQPKQTSNS